MTESLRRESSEDLTSNAENPFSSYWLSLEDGPYRMIESKSKPLHTIN